MNGGQFYPATVSDASKRRTERDMREKFGITDPKILKQIRDDADEAELWRNEVYTVAVFRDPVITQDGKASEMVHLSIKRNDREPIHDWRDLQDIKNQFVGPEREAVEIYPAESRRVDSANQYHLWCMPEGVRVPFGFDSRLVIDSIPGTKAKQRPFAKEEA